MPAALALSLALAAAPPAKPPITVADANRAFALALYQQLARKPGNLLFSPESLLEALAMTAAGAEGATAAELRRALHLGTAPDIFHGFASVLAREHAGSGYELDEANRLWVDKSIPLVDNFLAITGSDFRSEATTVDFAANAAAAREAINKWAAEQTHDHLTDLLPLKGVDQNTRLILTNAVYFKGKWQTEFDATATAPSAFHLDSGNDATVPFMHQRGRLPYKEIPQGALVEVPYDGGDLWLVLLIPNSVEGLDEIAPTLTAKKLDDWLKDTAPAEIDLTLPKFNAHASAELTPVLKALGIKKAFTNGAEFGGMTTASRVKISAVYHQASFAIDEQGAEASAATAVSMNKGKDLPDQPIALRADRPFLYLIRDPRDGHLLFIGRLADPR